MPRIKKEWFPIETAPENELIIMICEGIHPETKLPFKPVIAKIEDGKLTAHSSEYDGITVATWLTHWMPCPLNPIVTKLS